MPTVPSLLYALLWVGFGAGHSLFASAPGRRWLRRAGGSADRLAYNLIALAHLSFVLAAGRWLFLGAGGFSIPPGLRFGMAAVSLAGLLVLAIAGRSYDLGRFAGITQLRRRTPEAELPAESLATGGMNALVRHPLYLGLLMLLWGSAVSPFALATAACASTYILIGIRFEERKLTRLYGPAYGAYRARVPMLLPSPRRLPDLLRGRR